LRELNDQLLVSSTKQHELTERAEHAAAALRELNEVLEQRVEERTRQMATYQQQLRSLVGELGRTEVRERKRVATELHDNLAQLLAVCKMKVSAIQAAARQNTTVANEAASVKEFLGDGIAYTRTLMTDLRPEGLNAHDLAAAVESVARRMHRHGLKVRVADDGQPKPLDEDVLALLFESVRELLYNVAKHAGADQATVALDRADGIVRVRRRRRGRGLRPGGAGGDAVRGRRLRVVQHPRAARPRRRARGG
jgi:signal transduction histidine kinase